MPREQALAGQWRHEVLRRFRHHLENGLDVAIRRL
jgi:hypothetical protein